MSTTAHNAALTALEDEVSLKEDVIRTQSLEMESLRRELRVKEARCTDLESSQRIAQKELAKAQGMQHDLEDLVGALRRDTATHELQTQTEREQKATQPPPGAKETPVTQPCDSTSKRSVPNFGLAPKGVSTPLPSIDLTYAEHSRNL